MAPLGPSRRIHGTNAEFAPVSAMLTMIELPAAAVNLATSVSPAREIDPV
jgi:hypothetical protein